MSQGTESNPAIALAEMMRDLVDTLIPGEGGWPAASLVGVQGVVAVRLLEMLGEDALGAVEKAIAECGGPLSGRDAAGRVAILQRLETASPKLFELLRTAAYFAYYENPAVVIQIRSLGQPYQAIPILRGYDVGHFDWDRDHPRHNRGAYVPTENVARVDLSKIQH